MIPSAICYVLTYNGKVNDSPKILLYSKTTADCCAGDGAAVLSYMFMHILIKKYQKNPSRAPK